MDYPGHLIEKTPHLPQELVSRNDSLGPQDVVPLRSHQPLGLVETTEQNHLSRSLISSPLGPGSGLRRFQSRAGLKDK